jgi:hypothetical protein
MTMAKQDRQRGILHGSRRQPHTCLPASELWRVAVANLSGAVPTHDGAGAAG